MSDEPIRRARRARQLGAALDLRARNLARAEPAELGVRPRLPDHRPASSPASSSGAVSIPRWN